MIYFFKKNLKWIKAFVGIMVILILFLTFDFNKVISDLKNIPLKYIIFVFLIQYVKLFLYVTKWIVVVNTYSKIKFKNAFLIYWGGNFANLFGLGSLGQEFFKIFNFDNKLKGFLLSILDRGLSFCWFIFIAFIGYFLVLLNFESFLYLLGILSVLMFSYWVIKFRPNYIIWALQKFKFSEIINPLIFSFTKIKPNLLVKHLIISISLILVGSFEFSLLFKSLNLDINFFSFFVLIPLLSTIIILPITYNGMGLRELVFLFYSRVFGYPFESLIAFSLLLYFIGFLYQITGIIPFVLIKNHKIK